MERDYARTFFKRVGKATEMIVPNMPCYFLKRRM